MSGGPLRISPSATPRAMAPASRFAAAVASAVCSRSESVLFEKQPDSRRRQAVMERTRTMMIRMQWKANGTCSKQLPGRKLRDRGLGRWLPDGVMSVSYCYVREEDRDGGAGGGASP